MRIVSLFFFAIWALVLFRVVANLLLVRRLRGQGRKGGRGPLVSIIIPARDEARAIEHTLRAFLAQDYQPFEVIVVDGGSTDGTGDIARAIADPRLVVIAGEEPPPGWVGITSPTASCCQRSSNATASSRTRSCWFALPAF